MFEVGFTEILLILGIALLVLGPEKLPGLAEKVGRWTGRARAMARQLRTQLEHEVTMEEMTRARAAQPASPPPPPSPPETAAASSEAVAATAGPAAASSGPELDLDRMVSGVEPATPAAEFAAEDAAADAAVAADVPLTKSAP
jgi:sec-independent protein translocase protein TatB